MTVQQAAELMHKIPTKPKVVLTNTSSSNSAESTTKRNSPVPRQRELVVCYICNEPGHKSPDCPKAKPKCTTCLRFGHDPKDCMKSRAEPVRHITETKTLAIVKKAQVGGVAMMAYIDGVSQRSLIGRQKAAEIGGILPCTPFNIKEFGASPQMCSSMLRTEVIVDGQTYHGKLHLVDDDKLDDNEVLLGTKLLCGRGESDVW